MSLFKEGEDTRDSDNKVDRREKVVLTVVSTRFQSRQTCLVITCQSSGGPRC